MALINTTTTGVLGSTFYGDGTGDLTVQQNGVTVNKITAAPFFSAYGNAEQVIATGTYTKVAYNVEVYDTNNNYDTTNYRFLPTVAGYYLINAYTEWQNTASTALRSINLYRNGGAFRRSQQNGHATSGNIAASFTGAIYFNGTTDYVEMFVIQATGGNLSIYNNNGSTYNWFEGAFLRAA